MVSQSVYGVLGRQKEMAFRGNCFLRETGGWYISNELMDYGMDGDNKTRRRCCNCRFLFASGWFSKEK